MAFMRAGIEGPFKWGFIEDEGWFPYDDLDKESRKEVTETFYGYGGNLSASGYMDQTSWVVGETIAEVAKRLLDQSFDHFDFNPDDSEEREEALADGSVDQEELDDYDWLTEQVGRKSNQAKKARRRRR